MALAEEKPDLAILQVNTYDVAGGAEQVMWNLFSAYRDRGLVSRLAVGTRRSDDPDVVEFSELYGCRAGLWRRLRRSLSRKLGRDLYDAPATARLLSVGEPSPDLLHCHNLHGGYFDLSQLPVLSHKVPVVLTLHDAWAFSGHCAHSLGCERWTSGCGQCPDLDIYPAIRRDGTAYNWARKKRIFEQCRLYVTAPSRWLLSKLDRSILAPGVCESRCIPNGVDLTVFRPGNRQQVRNELGIPADAHVLLFVANGPTENSFKDYDTVLRAVQRIRSSSRKEVILLAMGAEAKDVPAHSEGIQFLGKITDRSRVARYYQAANLYLHAARAETFPNVVLEALASGVPVVATAVGGIPEQLKSLALVPSSGAWRCCGPEDATGVLVDPGSAEQMASVCQHLLDNSGLLSRLSVNAARDAATRFSLEGQVSAYLEWYRRILARWP